MRPPFASLCTALNEERAREITVRSGVPVPSGTDWPAVGFRSAGVQPAGEQPDGRDGPNARRVGHRAGLFRRSGPAPGGRRRDTLRRIVEALSAGGNQPAAVAEQRRSREPAFQGDGRRAGCWRCSFTACARAATGATAISPISRNCWKSLPISAAPAIGLNPLHALFYDRPDARAARMRRTAGCFSIRSTSTWRRSRSSTAACRDLPAISRGCATRDLVDYRGRCGAEARGVARGLPAISARAAARPRRDDFDAYPRRARPTRSNASPRSRRCGRTFRRRGGSGRSRGARPTTTRCAGCAKAMPTRSASTNSCNGTPSASSSAASDVARRRGLAIGLYLDTAVGVDAGGADAWMEQGIVLRGLSVGAPPDQFNPAGQDWGLTAYNPHGLVASRFEPFRADAARGHAPRRRGAHRPCARPDAALRHPARLAAQRRAPTCACRSPTCCAVVAEESRRWSCIVIGEDLGTVPENFRDTLVGLGRVVLSRHAVRARTATARSAGPSDYPERAIATFNTHDLPTFAGWMSGHDLKTKRAIGVDPGETDDDRAAFARDALRRASAATGNQQIGFEEVAAFLAATPTRLVSIAIEDVLGIDDQVNVPGTVDRASELAAALAGRCGGACVRSAAARASPRRSRAPAAASIGILIELARDRLDRLERRQARFVAEMLDLVGRRRAGRTGNAPPSL